MPIIQKLLTVGNSRMVVLPSSWLRYAEEKAGTEIREVELEVNGEIKVRPYLKEPPTGVKPSD